ncbi:MAG: tRNA pseudouridine synthase A [Sediminibacterium sp.]
MARYFIEVAYNGTHLCGFQIQDGQQTVQSVVAAALQTVLKEPMVLTGSSRTDAGVHAKQNFFHLDTAQVITGKHIYSINAILPPTVVVNGIYAVAPEAHARFDALARTYTYTVTTKKDPFLIDQAWHFPFPVSLETLQAMALELPKHQDFEAFSKKNAGNKTNICTIEISNWQTISPTVFTYTVRSNRFLRGMVRGLVGTMLRIARQSANTQEAVEAFKAVIVSKDPSLCDFSTPARGLVLEIVAYPAGALNSPI